MQLRLVSGILLASLTAVLAGCSAADRINPFGNSNTAPQPAAVTAEDGQAYVQGQCPQVRLREGTAYLRRYASGGETAQDPSKVRFQATIAETTRQCRVSNGQVLIDVVAAGRLLAGPAGGPGEVTMPIRVAVVRGEEVLFSELSQYASAIPSGATSTQFLFSRSGIEIPADAVRTAQVFVGFDEGPYDTP